MQVSAWEKAGARDRVLLHLLWQKPFTTTTTTTLKLGHLRNRTSSPAGPGLVLLCPPTRALSSTQALPPLPMREPSGHGHVQNGDQSPDDDDGTFSDTDSEKSLLSDSDAPEPARRHPRETPQPRLLDAEHEPRPVTLTGESDGRAEAQIPASNDDAVPVSWRHLPRKDQLIVITLARLSEPLVQTSLQVPREISCLPHAHHQADIRQSYMFYMLKWFDPELSDSVISRQAGILQCVSPVSAAPFPRTDGSPR